MNFYKAFTLQWFTHEIKKGLAIFIIGFCVYPTIEIVWNAILTPYEHKTFAGMLSMAILGGLLMYILGNLNEVAWIREKLPWWVQSLIGGAIVTALEFVAGLILNVGLGWHVWDYSQLPLNFMGQICLLYSGFWIVLTPIAFWIDDCFRLIYDHLTGRISIERYQVRHKKCVKVIDIGSLADLGARYRNFFKKSFKC